GSYGNDYQLLAAGTGGAIERFDFSNLSPGLYDVYVTWTAGASRSTAATWTTYDPGQYTWTSDGAGLFQNPQAPTLTAPTPLVGGRTVTINTSSLTITGDNPDASKDATLFYGSPFFGAIVNGIATFYVAGDVHIGADTINITGSRPFQLVV